MSSAYRKLLICVIALSFPLGASATTYSAIVLGQGNTNNGQNALQVVGLGASDGFAYLPVWQDASGTWYQTGILPGQGTKFSALVTGRASGTGLGKLQVIGLGANDGLAYVAAYQDLNGNWYAGGALPQSGTTYKQLVAATGSCSSHPLQVVGLGAADGIPYLVAFQDTNGNWSASAQALGTTAFSSISVGYGNGGNLQLFGVRASDGLPLLSAFQNNTNGACAWQNAGSIPAPSAIATKLIQVNGNHGNLQVLGIRASDAHAYLPYWQDSDGNWNAGGPIPDGGYALTALAGAQGNSSYLQLWGLGTDGTPRMIAWQNGSGTWGGVGTAPIYLAGLTSIAMGNGNNNNVQVIGLGVNNHIILASFQDSGSGTWYAGNDLTPSSGGGGGGNGCHPICP